MRHPSTYDDAQCATRDAVTNIHVYQYYVMPHCAAYGCRNSTAKDPDLYFMRFPDNRELCRQWLHNTGRGSAWKPTKHSHLCSEHFKESCFKRDLYAELMESDARCLRRRAKRLKADAVPTWVVRAHCRVCVKSEGSTAANNSSEGKGGCESSPRTG